jgi:acyl-CoA synthetase (NDP forming)
VGTEIGQIPQFDDTDPAAAKAVITGAIARSGEEGGWLEPGEVEALLDCFGIPRPASALATSEDEALEAARAIGGPVVLKVVSSEALHKSDVGGVLLDIEGDEAVLAGYRSIAEAVPVRDGILVQEMVKGGHEVLVGMTEDPNFGPMIVYGLGGIYVELLKDVAFRLHPLYDVDALSMIDEIKGAKLLTGYRNLPKGDVDAVADTLLRVSALISAVPEITEMDLNPLLVLEPGRGVRAVDARIRIHPIDPAWSPEMLDLPSVARGRARGKPRR